MDLTPLELIKTAALIDVTKVRELGLHMGFEFAEIQRYERANNQNPSQCKGTEDMLVAYSINGGTKELLCMALRAVEHGRLACKIEAGELRVNPVAVPPPKRRVPHAVDGKQPCFDVTNQPTISLDNEPAEWGTFLGVNLITLCSNKNLSERMKARQEGRNVWL